MGSYTMAQNLRYSCLVLLLGFLVSQAAAQSTSPAPKLPLEELLNGPDRQELPWKVTILPPRLMYQQRFIVQMRARIPADAVTAANGERNLHFILKVKGDDGSWLKEGQYNTFPVPADLGDKKDIEYATGVYLRPGKYTIALIAVEAATRKVSVMHREVHIEPIKDDPFSELDRYLPTVEFPAGFPQQEFAEADASDGELFPIAHQANWIQIDNSEPIQVDVVLNITERPVLRTPEPPAYTRMGVEARMRAMMKRPTVPTYHLDVGRVLQIGNVISHIGLKSGCVRVSAIDTMRMKTILNSTDEKKLDWDKFEAGVEKFDQNTVDAAVLANKKGPAQFFNKYLDNLSSASTACGPVSRHYVVVVSHELSLPSGAKDARLESVNGERARFYYVHAGISGVGDDISEILKPVKPERLGFANPREFRKSFARLVSDLRSGK
jgi:hypothetical protein